MMDGRPSLSDTSPDVERLRLDLYRRMSPDEKWRRVEELTRLAHGVALAGLRARHAGADSEELLLRLAVLRLGADLVARVYGRRPDGA
jgi:hypothetical protein